MLLEDKIVIVSGIGPGMGRDISLQCAEHGAHIVLASRTLERLEEVAQEVRSLGRHALSVPTDVTDPEQCQALAAATIEEFGRIDVLVNNAFKQPPFELFQDLSLTTWQESVLFNCTAAMQTTQAVLPQMKEQQNGSVVMINTMSIRRAEPYFSAYAAAKSALFSFARSIAAEVGPYGIRVNSVAPGYIWGQSVKWYFETQAKQRNMPFEEVQREITNQLALRRIPDSREISGTVVFLASELSAAVTGHTLDANGGHYLHF